MQEVTKRLPNNLLFTFAVAQGITRDALIIQKKSAAPAVLHAGKIIEEQIHAQSPHPGRRNAPLRKQEAPSAGAALRAAGKSESDYQSDGRPQLQQWAQKKTCGHKPTGFNSLCFNRRLLSYGSFSSSRVGSNSGAVSYSAVSSNAIYNSAIHSGRVNSLGVSGLVATRSERNSCESYEHEN